MSKVANKTLSSLLDEKTIRWKQIKAIVNTNTTTLDSLRRQALKRACLDPSVCKSTMKILLRKTEVDLEQRGRYIIDAVRCQNMSAITTLIYDNVAVLYWDGFGHGGTLLHLVCEKHGWNSEVALILKETLENKYSTERAHEGMFHLNAKMETPLKLSLQAGCELEEVMDHLKEEYPAYFESKVHLMPEIIAEYCMEMAMLQDLIVDYPMVLESHHSCNGSTPLHFACFYQNQDMLRTLLEEYRRREGRKLLFDRLLVFNNECMSPLGYLVLNLGDRDDGNAWGCVNICNTFFGTMHLLHLVLDRMWGQITEKRNCMRIIKQIMDRLQVDLSAMDGDGRTVLSILVVKMASCTEKKRLAVPKEILEYMLSYANSENAATMRDGKGRFPLHLACENALTWRRGLHSLVEANVVALEEYDPRTNLPPFALSASNSRCDLESIYLLLRYNPSVI